MKQSKTKARDAKSRRRQELTRRRMAAAVGRGKSAWQKLIVSNGGDISTTQVAKKLNLSEAAVLQKYRKRNSWDG